MTNPDIRRILLYEFLAFAGWFMFTWGAWSIIDYYGLSSVPGVTFIFLIGGISLFILSIVLTYTKTSGKKKK